MSSLCSVRSPLWVQSAAEEPLPLASGNNTPCIISQLLPWSLWGVQTPGSRALCAVGGGDHSFAVFLLTATEMSVCTAEACWLRLTSDYVFSGFRLNCQFLSARNLLNDSAHPCLLTGESNTSVGNRIFGEASNGLTFEPVPTTG